MFRLRKYKHLVRPLVHWPPIEMGCTASPLEVEYRQNLLEDAMLPRGETSKTSESLVHGGGPWCVECPPVRDAEPRQRR